MNAIKSNELDPRLVFHYGIPSGSISLAYDSVQKILAISTKDGRIKLLSTKDNTQALLESNAAVPCKFLQFLENQGVLFRVTIENHIEVWDIERKQLSYVYIFKEEITAFTVIQHTSFVYVGDSVGNVSVLKLDSLTYHLIPMDYNIPLSASHGNTTEEVDDTAVMYIMPQPMAESKRVLIMFRDGLIILWGVEESSVVLVMGGHSLSFSSEPKKVTSACWVCPFGSKVVVGYSSGEIYMWNIPIISNPSACSVDKEILAIQNAPASKLNLGYKMDKIPIYSLKWVYGEGKTSRLYVNGSSSSLSTSLFQVILLDEQTTSRMVKVTLPLPEPCLDMEIISCMSGQNKRSQNSLLLVLKSGRLCTYDDCIIENILLQSHSRPHIELPKELMVKVPFTDSRITVAKYITNDSKFPSGMDEDYNLLLNSFPTLLLTETRSKDDNVLNTVHFSGFAKIKSMYITGHNDGTVNFWDASVPVLVPLSSIQHQSEDGRSLSGIPVTALFFDIISRTFASGDESGTVRIFKFKPEPFTTESSFFSLQGSSKKGSGNIVQSVKLMKVNGVVLFINLNSRSKNVAVGTDKGNVYVIDIEGPTILFQNNITSEVCNGIMSLHFDTCSFHGFEKNILLVGTKDSAVVALESDTGVMLSGNAVHPKKPARALFMQCLDVSDALDANGGSSSETGSSNQSLLLFCNEKAVYIYSLTHVVQGIKKVLYKKKFHGTSCCWASTFYNHESGVALTLLFPGGKIEIRSLPELSLMKEITIRGFTCQNSKSDSFSNNSLCSSSDGALILVNGDQEIYFLSLLLHKEAHRFVAPMGHVYKKGMLTLDDESMSGPITQKEKKKGIFSSVMKDLKSNKAKNGSGTEVENSSVNIMDELSRIFSVANFPFEKDNSENLLVDKEDEVELNIDDIDFDDEKPKGQNMIAGLNKKQLTSKFLAIKGKLKQKMTKSEKVSAKAEHEDEKLDSVNDIKKKYGFSSSGDTSGAKMAENKLQENVRKLQGINLRATDMQGTAQSFSAMAKEMLRTAEKDKSSS